jgi:hypothetical protein
MTSFDQIACMNQTASDKAGRIRDGCWPQRLSGIEAWAVGSLLLLPVYLLYLAHFANRVGSGTGFLQWDSPYYMANARAHFDAGHFTLTYGLPFSPDPNTPRIYFQPLTLALGVFWKLTESDPGILFTGAGLVFAICSARVIIALYDEIVPLTGPAAWLGLLCFFWGGGLLTLTGFFYGLAIGKSPIAYLLYFDPFDGFWFLNLGRNLIFTTEAFYHLLFLGCILLVLRRRFAWVLVCAALLSASHPFSGLQLLVVLGAWSIVEWASKRPERPPLYFLLTLCMLTALHVGYYLVVLSFLSEEHRVLQQQWSLPWLLPFTSVLAAYGVVAMLAAIALVEQWRRTRSFSWTQRLFLIWFAVSLALAKHDLVITPVQPLHFTRGYIWTPLFLIGVPVLVRAIAVASRTAAVRIIVPGAIVGLFLFDNAVWFMLIGVAEHRGQYGIALDTEEWAIIEKFREPRLKGYLVVSQREELGYLATVYSPLRSWYSHPFNTPYSHFRGTELNRFFSDGSEPSAWHNRHLLAVIWQDEATKTRLEATGFSTILSGERFRVLARSLPH